MASNKRTKPMAYGRWHETESHGSSLFGLYAISYQLLYPAISHTLLQIVLLKTATESLLLGEVVGIVQGREIGDSFFGFFPTI